MGHDPQRLESVFDAALAKPDAAERAAFVAAACGGDADLRGQVERLLDAHFEPGDSLKPPPTGPDTIDHCPADHGPPAPAEGVGAVLAGKYQLLEALGRGGMGAVFLARQDQPVKRLVAVKVIKPGMDSEHVLARFEQERQALALMDHPHIARVLDAGTTDAGRPYFVMELVKGVPLTRYCDDHKLTSRERLQLFIPVCQAVQHAHQKGVIHRDLKPSNVLVALYDGKPVPKVIDFGVAKAVGQPLTDRTLVTGFGAVVGTLEYMSPEQAELNQLDIDTRSDVYSLGVLLYQLLTGSTPLDRKRSGSLGFAELLRRVREEEPPRPSTRLSSSETLPDIAAARQTEPARLTKLVRGELDWIVMKALAKDRDRRYETANGFARDIERYLADEPVSAGPPGAGYRLKKFLSRHRGPVLAASVVLLALVLGIVGTTWGLVWAWAAEGEAREAQTRAEQAKDKEAAERKQAEAVAGLLVSVFRQVDPDAEKKGGLGLKEQLVAQLDRAAANLQEEYAGQPLVRARLRSALGETQMGLGEWAKSQALFRAAAAELGSLLGEGHPETLAVQSNLGLVYRGAGRGAQAIQVLEQVRDRQITTLGPDDPATLTTLHNLGGSYRQVGRVAEAIQVLERVCDRRVATLGLKRTDTLSALSSLALAYRDAGRTADAMKVLEQIRVLAAEVNGPDHPETLAILTNLAAVYRDAGRAADAISLHKHVQARRVEKLGPDHLATLNTENLLAVAYLDAGDIKEAIRLYEHVRARRVEKLGPDDHLTLIVTISLALAYGRDGRAADAVKMLEQIREKVEKLGPNHPTTLATLNNLAAAYQAAGRTPEAVALFEQVRDRRTKKQGPDHPATLNTLSYLAGAYRQTGRTADAIALYEDVYGRSVKKVGPGHPGTLNTLSSLASALQDDKQFDRAAAAYRKWLAAPRKPPENPLRLADTQAALGLCLLHAGKPAEAEPVLREALAVRQAKQPDAWTTFETQSLVGAARLGQQKYAEAEPLLLKGYEGMKQHEEKVPAKVRPTRLAAAAQRLVQLYEATGQDDKAAAWRKKRYEADKPAAGR